MDAKDIEYGDDPCTECEWPIAVNALHYKIEYDLRRLYGLHIAVEHAETIATLCAKCSLKFDLTRLHVPNREGWHRDEPLGFELINECECALCRRQFQVGERFQSAVTRLVHRSEDREETLLTISLCLACAAKRLLRDAEPPISTFPPYCFQCGRYTGYTGGMEGERKHYAAHPSVTYPDPTTKIVRVCEACFFREPDDSPLLLD